MTQPIGGHGRSTYDYQSETTPETPLSKLALEFCTTANTVTSGFLCDELTVVSSACRTPTNDVDNFICDDRKMQSLQTNLARVSTPGGPRKARLRRLGPARGFLRTRCP